MEPQELLISFITADTYVHILLDILNRKVKVKNTITTTKNKQYYYRCIYITCWLRTTTAHLEATQPFWTRQVRFVNFFKLWLWNICPNHWTYKQLSQYTDGPIHWYTYRPKTRQTNKPTYWNTDRTAGRETDKSTDWQIYV